MNKNNTMKGADMNKNNTMKRNFIPPISITSQLGISILTLSLMVGAVSRGVSAGELAADFAHRNTPEGVAALADRFFARIDLEKPRLAAVKQAYEAGDPRAALKEYRAFFFDRLDDLDEMHWSLDWGYSGLRDSWQDVKYPEGVEDLLRDSPGQPGQVDWAEFDHHADRGLAGLLRSYVATGNPRYLAAWSDYIDDWTLRDQRLATRLPAEISDRDYNSNNFPNRIYTLRATGRAIPADGASISETALARYLLRQVDEFLPFEVPYLRSNPQNWTTLGATRLLISGLILEDLGFYVGDYYQREGLRVTESLGAYQQLPDGVDQESNLHYMKHYVQFNAGPVYELVTNLYPELRSATWLDELDYNRTLRLQFAIRMLTPRGRYNPGNRRDTRHRGNEARNAVRHAPGVLDNINNRRILDLTQGGDTPMPGFDSEAFPYGGFYNLRSGWGRQDQQGYLFTSPRPGNSSWRTMRGNNVFTLTAFDQELIVARQVGTYDRVRSPLRVNGADQNFHAGSPKIPNWGHRHRMTTAWDEPANGRWHASKTFNLAEAVYEGPFEDAGIEVAHGRRIYHLRDAGIWIVSDLLMPAENGEATYTQEWVLPVQPTNPRRAGHDYQAFNPDNIEIDPAGRRVLTQDQGQPNLSIYQFGPEDMDIELRVEEVKDGGWFRPKISSFGLLQTTFSGSGRQMLTSLIYPRADQETELVEVGPMPPTPEARRSRGFRAVLPDGSRLIYLAATDGTAALQAGDISFEAESLLALQKQDGSVQGLVLGATRAVQADEAVFAADFEFTHKNGTFTDIIPIYRPIQPVRILPSQTAFHDTLEVQMASATPGVDIRYTLNGGDPTAQSPLYSEPLVIDADAVVKARAFRPGVEEVPDVMSGTHATIISRAFYERQRLRPAETDNEASAATRAGLAYTFHQARWQDLFIDPARIEPADEGQVARVFDNLPATADEPYAVRYRGYLEVPASGVYTFHAPDELVRNNIMGGYDLRIHVGNQEWYPSTRRHAFGKWSIPLDEGKHPLTIEFIDFRGQTPQVINKPGYRELIWSGGTPDLKISGPGMEPQPIPAAWLRH